MLNKPDASVSSMAPVWARCKSVVLGYMVTFSVLLWIGSAVHQNGSAPWIYLRCTARTYDFQLCRPSGGSEPGEFRARCFHYRCLSRRNGFRDILNKNRHTYLQLGLFANCLFAHRFEVMNKGFMFYET